MCWPILRTKNSSELNIPFVGDESPKQKRESSTSPCNDDVIEQYHRYSVREERRSSINNQPETRIVLPSDKFSRCCLNPYALGAFLKTSTLIALPPIAQAMADAPNYQRHRLSLLLTFSSLIVLRSSGNMFKSMASSSIASLELSREHSIKYIAPATAKYKTALVIAYSVDAMRSGVLPLLLRELFTPFLNTLRELNPKQIAPFYNQSSYNQTESFSSSGGLLLADALALIFASHILLTLGLLSRIGRRDSRQDVSGTLTRFLASIYSSPPYLISSLFYSFIENAQCLTLLALLSIAGANLSSQMLVPFIFLSAGVLLASPLLAFLEKSAGDTTLHTLAAVYEKTNDIALQTPSEINRQKEKEQKGKSICLSSGTFFCQQLGIAGFWFLTQFFQPEVLQQETFPLYGSIPLFVVAFIGCLLFSAGTDYERFKTTLRSFSRKPLDHEQTST